MAVTRSKSAHAKPKKSADDKSVGAQPNIMMQPSRRAGTNKSDTAVESPPNKSDTAVGSPPNKSGTAAGTPPKSAQAEVRQRERLCLVV